MRADASYSIEDSCLYYRVPLFSYDDIGLIEEILTSHAISNVVVISSVSIAATRFVDGVYREVCGLSVRAGIPFFENCCGQVTQIQ